MSVDIAGQSLKLRHRRGAHCMQLVWVFVMKDGFADYAESRICLSLSTNHNVGRGILRWTKVQQQKCILRIREPSVTFAKVKRHADWLDIGSFSRDGGI